jgi:hypothetical protein
MTAGEIAGQFLRAQDDESAALGMRREGHTRLKEYVRARLESPSRWRRPQIFPKPDMLVWGEEDDYRLSLCEGPVQHLTDEWACVAGCLEVLAPFPRL